MGLGKFANFQAPTSDVSSPNYQPQPPKLPVSTAFDSPRLSIEIPESRHTSPVTMSFQDKAQHQIGQIDKEVGTPLTQRHDSIFYLRRPEPSSQKYARH